MESSQISESKKRTQKQVLAQELACKIKSKVDLIDYLDKHRKCANLSPLTPM